jgi:glucose/arabinose dehydrogenase
MHRRVAVLCAFLLSLGFDLRVSAAPVIVLDQIVAGLSVPTYVTQPDDGSGRLFVLEKTGRIRIFDTNTSTLLGTDFLNLGSSGLNLISTSSEEGLLCLVFAPDFVTSGVFYLSYTRTDGANIVSRWTATPPSANVADTGSESVILGPIAQPQANHNGGMLAMGPDGNLYLGVGDGGNSNDTGTGHNPTTGNGQDINVELGKILRFDITGAPVATNPFFGATPGDDFIFAYGLRNPWRFSFDRANGRLFCGDVGQNRVEEVDLIVNGGNYGWRVKEGNECFNVSDANNPLPTCTDPPNYVAPIFTYNHGSGNISITGGYVYRGPSYPNLTGLYIYADYGSGRIWSLEEVAPGVWSNALLIDAPFQVSSFGEDVSGELYVVDYSGGRVLKIRDTAPTVPVGLSFFGQKSL